jgi:hypothetical protein
MEWMICNHIRWLNRSFTLRRLCKVKCLYVCAPHKYYLSWMWSDVKIYEQHPSKNVKKHTCVRTMLEKDIQNVTHEMICINNWRMLWENEESTRVCVFMKSAKCIHTYAWKFLKWWMKFAPQLFFILIAY